jgi:hypothetical protein
MSPSHRFPDPKSSNPLYRKLAIAAAAIAVIVPTAYGTAFAQTATSVPAAASAPAQTDADGDSNADGSADPTAENPDQQNPDAENPDQQNQENPDAENPDQQDPGQKDPNLEDPAAVPDVNNPAAQVPDPENPAGESTDVAGQGKNADAEAQAKKQEKKPGGKNNGLDVLGRDCKNSNLPPHDGFQNAPRCVSTAFGEVAAADKSPSLLITQSPDQVAVGKEFTLKVSTRNLVRDRFLGAAAGGYYLESSFLNGDGLQRGHFHTACRMLDSTNEAPDSSKDPEFFVATQDNGGGADSDTVTITVPGLPTKGEAQCTSWAGDGSHRTPMMQRANQTPAIDSVRITVN